MYYRIESESKKTGLKIYSVWFKTGYDLKHYIGLLNGKFTETIHRSESTEFLVLNGISIGKGSTNQYKPATVF